MIIERIAVTSFGPLSGEIVDLRPGMNVVFGANEAAKSTLHAALFAGLCGMRRSRGSPRSEDREFDARHRPWDGEAWKVQLVMRLADGRRIELDQDLGNLSRCRARDLTNGRDVTNEIVFEGTPDASRWLGLTRRSFLSTACVRQAELMAVAADPATLQEELQRAAATAGRDETAAAAIARLKHFHSERVGLDRANSTKPLRRAREGERLREEELIAAKSEHGRVLLLLEQADELDRTALEAELAVGAAEAALAERRARDAESTLKRISELAEQHPTEPSSLSADQERADRVAAALALWEGAPVEPDLAGPSTEQLRDEILALPDPPTGDTQIHDTVRTAVTVLAAARGALDLHGDAPPRPERDEIAADDDELRQLATTLSEEAPALDAEIEERLSAARKRYEHASKRPRPYVLAVGALLTVGGLIVVFVSALLGALLVIAGVAAMAWALSASRAGAARVAALEELRTLEADLGEARHRIDVFRERTTQAEARCAALHLSPDPAAIQALLAARASAALAAQRRADWEEKRRELEDLVTDEEANLRSALVARGVTASSEVDRAFAEYESACRGRTTVAAEAGRRPQLEATLDARAAAEQAAKVRAEAVSELLTAAAEIGVSASEAGTAAEDLRTWQRHRDEELVAHETALAEWNELQTLLGGETFEAVKETTSKLRVDAETLAEGIDRGQIDEASRIERPEEELRHRRALARTALETAREARGEAQAAATRAPSIPDAEERSAAAGRELERVESLDQTLRATLEYLERAQERVHRDIAPILANTIVGWLPRVTAHRYEDALVDPETLEVRVRSIGGDWREANRLSHGTREQIYLLLRIALSEHLVAEPERAPLLFDEVTAHCDASRRESVLSLLHDVSAERQVIVFTHEDPVREWAEVTLTGDRDRLFVREPVPIV